MRKVALLWLLAAVSAVSYGNPEGEWEAEEPLDAFPAEASLTDDVELKNTRRDGEEVMYFGEDLQLENSPRDGEEADAAQEVNEYTDLLTPLDREQRGASVEELSEELDRQKRSNPAFRPHPKPHPRPMPHPPRPKPRPHPRLRR